MKSVGEGGVGVGDLLQRLHADRGAVLGGRLGRVGRHRVPVDVDGLGPGVADLAEDTLQPLLELRHHGLGVLDGDVPAADQGLGVELADRALLLDQVVHPGLGEAGVVALVVPAPAVAHQVDHHVLVELLAEREGQPGHPDARFGVVAVDVEDRCLDHPGHVGAVDRGPGLGGGGGEADLVVDDDVDRAAGPVAAKLAQVQRLGHHTLAGEGGVSVHQHRQHRELPAPVEDVLLGPGDALQHRVDRLQMAGVGGHGGLDRRSGERSELTLGPQVVLHVTGALHGPADRCCPRTRGRSARRTCPPRWPARSAGPRCGMPMQTSSSPASAACSQTSSSRAIADSPPSREKRFWPTNLVCRKVSKISASLSLSRIRRCSSRGQRLVRALHPVLDPLALGRFGDVHVLDAGRPAVGVAQDAQDLAHLHQPLAAGERSGGELPVQVPQGQPVGLHVEIVVSPLPVLQRVGVGHQMTPGPVGVDHLHDPGLLGDLVLVLGADVLGPADRLVGDPQRAEHVVVEAVLTQQQGMQPLQVLAGLRPLDDPVVVRGGQRHDLRRRSCRRACPDRSPGTPAGTPSSRHR